MSQPQTLREKIARAICVANGRDPEWLYADTKQLWQAYLPDADAALSVIAAESGWRDISSAPKDGEFLVWNEEERTVTHWNGVAFWQAKDGKGPLGFAQSEVAECSAWMPLPAPPASAGERE